MLTVKVGGGDADDRIAVFDAAATKPWRGDWRKGRRRPSNHIRLWTLDAGEMTAGQAAKATLRLDNYIATLVAS